MVSLKIMIIGLDGDTMR